MFAGSWEKGEYKLFVDRACLLGDENVLEVAAMVAQLCEYIKSTELSSLQGEFYDV